MADIEIKEPVRVGIKNIPINNNLIAQIFPVQKMTDAADSYAYVGAENSPIVQALLEDGEFSLENQYQTPFENSNPELKMPSLMAMIQSGEGLTALSGLMTEAPQGDGIGSKIMSGLIQVVKSASDYTGLTDETIDKLKGLTGKTSFTKLNSQQIYLSSNSVKITGTLVLTAWADAKAEVEDALRLLQSWTVSKFLSDNGLVVNSVQGVQQEGFIDGALAGIFSGEVPPTVALTYGGKTYSPLVIESLSAPITAPMNSQGNRIAIKVQISLSTLRAWDKRDVNALYGIAST